MKVKDFSATLDGMTNSPADAEGMEESVCHAVASAVGAEAAWLFSVSGGTDSMVCQGAWPGKGDTVASPGEGLAAAACMAREPVSRHERDKCGVELLRIAVPAARAGRCTHILEIVKPLRAGEPPGDDDLRKLRTFVALYAGYKPEPPLPAAAAAGFVGKSSAFSRMQAMAAKAARGESPVLILGETGTGKELIARQLHDMGRRAGKPYVAINCGALSETLLESEFFGHVKGAFTGADRNRKGRIEEADGGTVFLDEVAEMSPKCQTKLLRTLDSGEVTPLGGNRAIRVNVRFIAATHRNLEQLIQKELFREDLFYRLQGMRIELPPLRRRRGDTELLAEYFLHREAVLQGSPVAGFSPVAMELIRNHHWPGNIRELRQVIASAVTLAEGRLIEAEDLPGLTTAPVPPSSAVSTSGDGTGREKERERIIEALAATAYEGTGRWNVRAAARLLGMNHQALAYRIKKIHRLNS